MKLSKNVDRTAMWLDFSRPSHSMPILRLCRLLGLSRVRSIDDDNALVPPWMPSDLVESEGLPIAGDFRRSSWLPIASWDVNLRVLKAIPSELSWTGQLCAGSLYHPKYIDPVDLSATYFNSFGCSVAYDKPDLASSVPHYTGAAAIPESKYLKRVLGARKVALSAGVVHCQLALNFPHDEVTLVAYGNDQRDNLHHVCSALKKKGHAFERRLYLGMPAITFPGLSSPLFRAVDSEAIKTFTNYIKEAP